MYSCKKKCPLCCDSSISFFYSDKKREYWRCDICRLVFVPPEFQLSTMAEKAEYDKHNNTLVDEGYRKFLSRMFNPVQSLLQTPADGLDFGCGPGPLLAKMFRDSGYQMSIYDLFYENNPKVLEQKYDFITATEVFEHLREPGRVLEQLMGMLNQQGILGVMTKRVTNQSAFEKWHYKNDQTHICFFSIDTFCWIASRYNCEFVVMGDDVVLLRIR